MLTLNKLECNLVGHIIRYSSFVFFLTSSNWLFSQHNSHYEELISKADSLFIYQEYAKSGVEYFSAFRLIKDREGFPLDYYNSARVWALSGHADSAFTSLFVISRHFELPDLERILKCEDFTILHKEKRWKSLITELKLNEKSSKNNINIQLAKSLDSIVHEDQMYRKDMKRISKEFGTQSKEMLQVWRKIKNADSTNLIFVTTLLSQDNILSPRVIGKNGVTAIFLVIQHADHKTREKYLPTFRIATKKMEISSQYLAYLEDRNSIESSSIQKYGTQLTGYHSVLPIFDPDRVDQRRHFIELPSMSTYLKQFGENWNLEEYKSKLIKEK
jgi:hypothetical protein